jgi:predicted YcjX-like family ATPase
LQLCALRYPGRLLRPGEIIAQPALQFVAGQLGTAPEALTSYAVRFQTRYEQLGALRTALGFTYLAPQQRQILEWLLPVALATTNPLNVATALLDANSGVMSPTIPRNCRPRFRTEVARHSDLKSPTFPT